MAKEVTGIIKLQIRGGAANPAPPVGPALGAKGVNIMEFCKQFNARTQDKPGKIVPVVITVFADKSFEFIINYCQIFIYSDFNLIKILYPFIFIKLSTRAFIKAYEKIDNNP